MIWLCVCELQWPNPLNFCIKNYYGELSYFYGNIDFNFFGTNLFVFKYVSTRIIPELGIKLYIWRDSHSFRWYLSNELYNINNTFGICTKTTKQIINCTDWYVHDGNIVSLNIIAGHCDVINDEYMPNNVCSYGHIGMQYSKIINEWYSIGYGRINNNNDIRMVYYVDKNDDNNEFIYLLYNKHNQYVWCISGIMNYHLDYCYAYCTAYLSGNNDNGFDSLSNCHWNIKQNNSVYQYDYNFKIKYGNCFNIHDNICLYGSNNNTIDGDYQHNLAINYYNAWFKHYIYTNYYIAYDGRSLKWIVSNNADLSHKIRICNDTDYSLDILKCNYKWYYIENNSLIYDTNLTIFNHSCQYMPTLNPEQTTTKNNISFTKIPTFIPTKTPIMDSNVTMLSVFRSYYDIIIFAIVSILIIIVICYIGYNSSFKRKIKQEKQAEMTKMTQILQQQITEGFRHIYINNNNTDNKNDILKAAYNEYIKACSDGDIKSARNLWKQYNKLKNNSITPKPPMSSPRISIHISGEKINNNNNFNDIKGDQSSFTCGTIFDEIKQIECSTDITSTQPDPSYKKNLYPQNRYV